MAKKEVFRLTENDIHNVLMESIKRVLKEGSVETSDWQSWNDIKDRVGADTMLDGIWDILNMDQIQELLADLWHYFDFDNQEDEEEYEEDEIDSEEEF